MKAILNTVDLSTIIRNKDGFIIEYAPKKQGTDRKSIGGKKYSGAEGRIAIITIATTPLDEDTLSSVVGELTDRYVTFNYDDPVLGLDRTIECIPSITRVQLAIEGVNDQNYYYGITFSLEERG